MQAAVLPGIRKPLALQEMPDPVAAPGGAVVRLKTAALNHRDLWIQLGQYAKIQVPAILGSDGAGTVESVGSDSDRHWIGREVVINPSLEWGSDPRAQSGAFRILGMPDAGTFAEKISVSVANLAPKPLHLTWEQAAALPLAGLTAWRALFTRARLQPGEKVLVTGAGGGVAHFAVQFAAAAGATVWVTSSSPEKIARVRSLGAAGGANYRESDWTAKLAEAAGGLFDVIVDGAGGESFPKLVELTRPGGRLVVYGATTGNPPGLDLRKCFFRQISIHGSTMGSPEDFAGLVRFVTEKRVVPAIDHVSPLAEAEAALRRMESGGQCGKLVLRC